MDVGYFWFVVPGLAAIITGMGMTLWGAIRHSGPEWMLRSLRLRFLGWAMLFALPGLGLAINGLFPALDVLRIIFGLVLIGMGGLWLYALGGVTRRSLPDPPSRR